MRIRTPGKVNDRIWLLGREESGVYLIEGDNESIIISGGMSYLIPDLLSQFKEFGIREERIKKILILHSHFDHIGIIPFFKRRNPEIEIYGSERAWEILRMEKAILTINEFGRKVAQRLGKEEVYLNYDIEWRADIEGGALREGSQIDLGEVKVSIIEIPGHSSCCIAAYVPELKALFPTDGGGIPFNHTIVTSGNSNYTKYQESLEKLKPLEVEYYCADHYGYVTGEEAKEFISKTIEMAKMNRKRMEDVYRLMGDVDSAAKRLVDAFYHAYPSYFLSPEIYLDVYRQMIRHIASTLDEKH